MFAAEEEFVQVEQRRTRLMTETIVLSFFKYLVKCDFYTFSLFHKCVLIFRLMSGLIYLEGIWAHF